MAMRARLARLCWTISGLWLACAGISPKGIWYEDLATLESRVAQGRHEEVLDRARELESRIRGDDVRCPILLARARALAGLERYGEALEAFRRVARTCPGEPIVSARALFEVGVLLATRSADPMDALPVFRRVVTLFPEEPAARRAVTWIRAIVTRHRGGHAAVEEMRRLYREVPRSVVAPYLLFEAAEVLRETQGHAMGDANRLALYALLLRRHPESHLADDAAVEAARLCVGLGYPWVAVRLTTAVLRRHETSWWIGSYDTPIYPEAAFLRAEALLAAGEQGRAAEELVRFARDYPRDPRVAEALFQAYHLFGSLGRVGEARESLQLLVSLRPRTAQAREARRIMEEWQ